MDDYVRLSEAASPTAGRVSYQADHARRAMQNSRLSSESDDEEHQLARSASSWWQRLKHHPAPSPQSGYLTLVPLSDARLKPPRTKLIVGILLFLTTLLVGTVYTLVARGVTVGTILVHSSHISFNTSKSTYQIILSAALPVYNPNFTPVRVSGILNVSFYDQQAGYVIIEPTTIPAKAAPEVITVKLDASSVPQKYLFTIYTQCFTFPERLIFFLKTNLQAEYLGKTVALPVLDTYFIINCSATAHATAVGTGSNSRDHLPNIDWPTADQQVSGGLDTSDALQKVFTSAGRLLDKADSADAAVVTEPAVAEVGHIADESAKEEFSIRWKGSGNSLKTTIMQAYQQNAAPG